MCSRELVLNLIFNDTEMTDCHFQVIKDYILISATDTMGGNVPYPLALTGKQGEDKKISTLKQLKRHK